MYYLLLLTEMLTTNTWITMSVLIKLILTLSCSLNFTSVSTKSVQVTPSTQQISSHPTSQQSRSTYEVLVSIEEKLSFFNTVATPVYLNEDQQYYTFNQIGRRIDVVDARLSHIEENLELKMHKILEVISTKDAQGQQFIELKNRIDVGLEKLFGKMNMVEVKSSGHSEQDEFKITNLEKTLVDRLDNVAEKILKLEDRTTRIEELWTKHLNRISQTISRLQVCTKEQSVDFLRKRFEDSSTMADDATAFRTSSGGDLREESELSENVHGTNFSYQTNMPRQQTFDTDTADVISVFPTVPYGWNNITEMLDETLKVIETKFKEVDSNLEIYTRKTFNAYQELLNDSKGIDDYLSKIVNQDNQTRVIVREGFRKLFHHMKPLSTLEETLQSLHKKVMDMGSTLDTSFASLLVAQNTFIATCNRIQQQETQIEDKIHHLLQRITAGIEDKLVSMENNTMWKDFETHRRDVGRALHDLVWTVITVGNQTVEDVKRIVNQHIIPRTCECQSNLNMTPKSST